MRPPFQISLALMSCLLLANVARADPRHDRPFTIRDGDCHFASDVEKTLSRLRDAHQEYADRHHIDMMVPHTEYASARFAFAGLRVIGLAAWNDAEVMGDRLYFAESVATVISVLQRQGFHVSGKGEILEARSFEDEDGLSATVKGIARARRDRHVPNARSQLDCASV